jgi:hypothetical protein
MEDHELLKKYEPILYFPGQSSEGDYSERFFPTDVYSYIGRCDLWRVTSWSGLRWFLSNPAKQVKKGWLDEEQTVAVAIEKHRVELLGNKNTLHYLQFLQPQKNGLFVQRGAQQLSYLRLVGGCAFVIFLLLLVPALLSFSSGIIWLGWLFTILSAAWLVALIGLVILHFVDDENTVVAVLAVLGILFFSGLAYWARGHDYEVLMWMGILLAVFNGMVILGGLLFIAQKLLSPEQANMASMVLGFTVIIIPCGLLFSLWMKGWITLLVSLGLFSWLILSIIGTKLVSLLLELTSPLRDKDSDLAHGLAQKMQLDAIQTGKDPFVYYGRVWRKPEESDQTVLQYFFFYPFNDWRRQDGFNFHEGDWECVFVFLDQSGEMTGVGISQHNLGDYRDLNAPDLQVRDGHPVVYVAAGSHANYFSKADVPISQTFNANILQRLLRFIEKIRLGNIDEKATIQENRDQAVSDPNKRKLAEARERPNGLGLVLGPETDESVRGRQENWRELNPEDVLRDEALPGWVKYPGLWGRATLLQDESGPTGPMWDRPWHKPSQRELKYKLKNRRLYWVTPLGWRDEVRKQKTESETKK